MRKTRTIYKYKAGNNNDIEALLANKLFVTSLDQMNDPLEFGFFVDDKANIKDINEFQSDLMRSHICISFSTNRQDRRLWNYYTDGMKGMVIQYAVADVEKSIKKKDRCTVFRPVQAREKKTEKYSGVAFAGLVKYDNKKIDMSELYGQYEEDSSTGVFIDTDVLFTKDKSWKAEREYRFVTLKEGWPLECDKKSRETYCEALTDLIPKAIYIGYRMENEKVDKIKNYCSDKKIPLYRCAPDFHSESTKDFVIDKINDIGEKIKM